LRFLPTGISGGVDLPALAINVGGLVSALICPVRNWTCTHTRICSVAGRRTWRGYEQSDEHLSVAQAINACILASFCWTRRVSRWSARAMRCASPGIHAHYLHSLRVFRALQSSEARRWNKGPWSRRTRIVLSDPTSPYEAALTESRRVYG
jgi:hypothetical protein